MQKGPTPLPCFRMDPRDPCFIPEIADTQSLGKQSQWGKGSDFFQKFIISRFFCLTLLNKITKK